jgi:hypothetical protein
VSIFIRAFLRIVSLFIIYVVSNILLRIINRSIVDLVFKLVVLRDIIRLSISIISYLLIIIRESFLKVVDFYYIRVSGFSAEAPDICRIAVFKSLSDLVVVLAFKALFV